MSTEEWGRIDEALRRTEDAFAAQREASLKALAAAQVVNEKVNAVASRSTTWSGCRHAEVVPVESVLGEVVAHLCLTCDEQLP